MCARGAPYDHFGTALAFYSPGIGMLDADWLQRVNCGALIGWSLQRVTSLRHAVAAKVLLLGKRFLRLATLSLTVALSSSTMELLIRGVGDSGKGADL